jgi:hypothetical protein
MSANQSRPEEHKVSGERLVARVKELIRHTLIVERQEAETKVPAPVS